MTNFTFLIYTYIIGYTIIMWYTYIYIAYVPILFWRKHNFWTALKYVKLVTEAIK